MTILVIAELENQALKSDTAKVVTAASSLNQDIHLLVAGHEVGAAVEAAAQIAGVSKVLVADDAIYANSLAENLSALIVNIGREYSHIFAAASSTGKDVLPRASALLDVAMLSEIISVESEDTFIRPIYAGNALATVQSLDTIKVATVRTAAFDAAGEQPAAEQATLQILADSGLTRFISSEIVQSERPDLGAAKVIVSGGRGVGSRENFAIIEALADKMGAAVGASRAAVDAGYIANDLQVGQTGKIVAPELYLAIGISGAIQHLAGMKDSKVIVAINKDVDAPIFQIADYGLEGDLFELVPQLTNQL